MKLSFLAIILFVTSSTAGKHVNVTGLVSFGLVNTQPAPLTVTALNPATPATIHLDNGKSKKHGPKKARFNVASCAKGRTDGTPFHLRYNSTYHLNEIATFTFNDRLKKGVKVARGSIAYYNVRLNKKLIFHNHVSLCKLVEKAGDGRCPLNNTEISAFRWQGSIDIHAVINAFNIVKGDRVALGASARNRHTNRLLFCVRGLLIFE